MTSYAGKRVLVVGGSASIGEAIAEEAAKGGARVAVAARRKDKLDDLVSRLGGDSVAIKADSSNPDDCVSVVEEAVAALGGLDWLVYTPALFLLRELEEITPEDWRRILDVNLVGAALVTRAALPHLVESRGRAAYFSSESTPANPHWPGLAAYAVSKVALDKMISCWRSERPEIGFTMVQVGGTEGSDGPVNGAWTPEQIDRFVSKWTIRAPSLQPRSVVAQAVLDALATSSYVEHVTVAPPRI